MQYEDAILARKKDLPVGLLIGGRPAVGGVVDVVFDGAKKALYARVRLKDRWSFPDDQLVLLEELDLIPSPRLKSSDILPIFRRFLNSFLVIRLP